MKRKRSVAILKLLLLRASGLQRLQNLFYFLQMRGEGLHKSGRSVESDQCNFVRDVPDN